MSSEEARWDRIAEAYARELRTSVDDVHFGVGLPGNRTLRLIPATKGGQAVDVGCGSGENMIALAGLGYDVLGIDSSMAQLSMAEKLLRQHSVPVRLIQADVAEPGDAPTERFDLLLSVGTAHFAPRIDAFVALCAKLLKQSGLAVLSVPHPVDMAVERLDVDGRSIVSLLDYFPPERLITNAHYWNKFGGRINLAEDLAEYICRPSDVVNEMINQGFQILGIHEPAVLERPSEAPCEFVQPDGWFANTMRRRVPQMLIVVARLQKTDEPA